MAGMITPAGSGAPGTQGRTRAAAREMAPWVEPLARAGYATKGAVYLIIGILAAQAAFGAGGAVTDSEGAFATILRQPLGQLLLVLVAVGLFGYALWRLVTAVADTEREGSDARGIAVRTGFAARALVYAGLGVQALRLVSGNGGGSGGDRAEDWTARALALPAGRWLVGLAGAGVVVYGLYQLRRAKDGDIRDRLDLSELGARGARWVVRIGQVGVAARAVVFAMIGWFLIRAAWEANAERAGGLGDALRGLAGAAYGPWVLGLVALGLAAFGVWQVVNARYRRIGV
ncbi:MAG TPA: DUF1206 domain-containing protein [Gemmatimonadaceae bacterium]|nr:DUF1206 domain-containing protein [Gemmatimonadaceae bacterium]